MAVVVGLGPFAGVMAIVIHSIGAMGKLYSESIESIDPGPIEAITATGANRLQVIWASVLPQLVNPFVSFSIYRLDTNVRLAIIIGLLTEFVSSTCVASGITPSVSTSSP